MTATNGYPHAELAAVARDASTRLPAALDSLAQD